MSKPAAQLPSAAARQHALMGARTRRLAKPRRQAEPVASIACLVCEVGGSLYALPIARAARVAPFRRASPMPTANPALLGVMGRAGVFYHVFDLGRLVGSGGAHEGGHVVLLRGAAPAIALRVDAAARVADLVELAPDATSRMRASHPAVKGFARPIEAGLFEGRMISLLDVDQLTSVAAHGRIEGE